MKSNKLDPPFLEFSFFVGTNHSAREMISAANILGKRGGRLVRRMELKDVEKGKVLYFDIESLDEACDILWQHGDKYLRRMYIDGVTGLTNKPEVIEAYDGRVLLRTEGELFCGSQRSAKALVRAGTKVYRVFTHLAASLEAWYGALLVEYTLEGPHELVECAQSLAFRDFFLSRRHLGESLVDEVLRIVGEKAFVESVGGGVYCSLWYPFNPAQKGVSISEAFEISVQVAEVLARFAHQRHARL